MKMIKFEPPIDLKNICKGKAVLYDDPEIFFIVTRVRGKFALDFPSVKGHIRLLPSIQEKHDVRIIKKSEKFIAFKTFIAVDCNAN